MLYDLNKKWKLESIINYKSFKDWGEKNGKHGYLIFSNTPRELVHHPGVASSGSAQAR